MLRDVIILLGKRTLQLFADRAANLLFVALRIGMGSNLDALQASVRAFA